MVCCGAGTVYLGQPHFGQRSHDSLLEQLFQFSRTDTVVLKLGLLSLSGL